MGSLPACLPSPPVRSRCTQFDAVFGPTTPQHTVFTDVGRLLQSAVDGHNVSIIAFGQTGSGKSYSMFGPELQAVGGSKGFDGAASGIAPRIAAELFRILRLQRTPQWTLGPDDVAPATGAGLTAGSGAGFGAGAGGESKDGLAAGSTGTSRASSSGVATLAPLHTSLGLDAAMLGSPRRSNFHAAYTTRVRVSMFDVRGPYVSDVLRSTETPAAPLALVPGEDGIMYVEGGTTVEVNSEAELITVITTGLRHRCVRGAGEVNACAWCSCSN